MRDGEERDPEVDRPAHYDGDECMVALEAAGWGRSGCLFNVGKYLWRLGKKGRPLQDAQKALWYATRFQENAGYNNGAGLAPHEKNTIETCIHRACAALSDDAVQEVAPTINAVRDALGMKI